MAIRKKTLPTKWGKRSIENLNNWEDVDINNFSSDKPIVICLSGNGALNAKHANGFCKRASKFLELLLKDRNSNKQVSELVDIIGCSYGYNARIEIPDMETEEQKAEFFKKYPTIPDYIKEYPNKISYDSYGKISEEELDDFVDRVLHGGGGIQGDEPAHTLRHDGFFLCKEFFEVGHCFKSIGICCLVDCQNGAGAAFSCYGLADAACQRVALRA